MKSERRLLVALVGKPNVGKSTVFNILTGLSQHVGNWPGKTIERKEGIHLSGNTEIRLVDLPGTYSLTAYSEEERIARDFIINDQPDVVVLIANAASLEKDLYLLSELLSLRTLVVVALNMMDVAEGQGIYIDTDNLRKSLGVPVIPMVATKNKGIKELVSEIVSVTAQKVEYNPAIPDVAEDHRDIFFRLKELIGEHILPPYPVHWVTMKLMEGDPDVLKMLKNILPTYKWNEIQALLMKHEDSLFAVVKGKYKWIRDITSASVLSFKKGQILMTDRIDQVLTRPLFGIPILLGVIAFVFLLTFKIGLPIQGGLEWLIGSFVSGINPALHWTPEWVRGLLIDGVIGGVGSVLTLLPILVIFFALMAFLEDTGYMARVAFVMDRFMHTIGLHGKSLLPMLMGFGCNVPAVLGARSVESIKARLLTIFLTPFVPCAGRLAVLAFVAAAIFGERATTVCFLLVVMNILTLGAVGVISRFLLKEEPMPFIMELPLYQKPHLKTIGIVIWNRTKVFLKRAGTIILTFSILIWVISNFPGVTIEASILGLVGRLIEPLGALMGLDWKMMVALLSSFIGKETTLATLAVLYGVGEEGLRGTLSTVINTASALSFLVISMLFIPCAATLIVLKQEMGSWRWFLSLFILTLFISFGGGIVAYQLALLLGI